MSFHPSSGFDYVSFDPPLGPLLLHSLQNLAQNALNPDRIPPPASVATINGDAIDLNDEVFFQTAQSAASPMPLNSNYLLDLYPVDPGSFPLESPKPASLEALEMAPIQDLLEGSPPNQLPLKPRELLALGIQAAAAGAHLSLLGPRALELEDASLAAEDLSMFLDDSGEPQYVDSEIPPGVKLALSTPELASAEAMCYNVHYLHQNRFSAAVEQMHRMSLHGRLSSTDQVEKTINPKQLLDFSASSISPLQNYSLALPDKDLDLLMRGNGAPEVAGALKPAKSYSSPSSSQALGLNRYLSTLVLSPQLLKFFSLQIPDLMDHLDHRPASPALNNPLNPYVMNDECVSAITYWLNNTADVIQDKPKDSVVLGKLAPVKHPLRGHGVSKSFCNRRNLIQIISGLADASSSNKLSAQKRKRRKSDHLSAKENKSAVSEIKFTARSTELVAELGFAVISESDPSISCAIAMASDLPERLADTKEHSLDTGDGQSVEAARGSAENAAGPPAEGEDDGPKPFPCNDCEKQFKRLEHLKRHIRSVHSKIRPFHCKYCEKKFSRSDNLAQHLKTHFKINANGTTSVIYGNPNPYNRAGRKQSVSEMELH